jgi:hypothetical protein
VLDALRVVADTAAGVVEPNAAGAAQSAPSSKSTLRLATLVVDAMTKGAEPVANVDVIAPVALRVVNAPAAAVDVPTGPLNESPTAPV